MRDILFRAKRKDNGEWVYWDVFGQIVCDDEKTFNFITYFGVNYWKIVDLIPLLIAETVGQWTGMTDKNGKRIFEGDIVRYYSDGRMYVPTVNGGWALKGDPAIEEKTVVEYEENYGSYVIHKSAPLADLADIVEIIGNIHDSPELLEGAAE